MNQDVAVPIPQWWMYNDGHVLAGAILVRNDLRIEAQLLLDGALVYGSRHSNRATAEGELADLRGHCAREGWA